MHCDPCATHPQAEPHALPLAETRARSQAETHALPQAGMLAPPQASATTRLVTGTVTLLYHFEIGDVAVTVFLASIQLKVGPHIVGRPTT